MAFEWNNIEQSSRLVDSYFFYPFYEKLSQVSKESTAISLGAPVIGLVDGAASLVQAVGGVGEAAIKGVGNVLSGAVTSDTGRLKIGGLQLGLGVGVVGVLSIPLIVFRTLRITGGMLIHPEQTSNTQAENYRKKVQAPPILV